MKIIAISIAALLFISGITSCKKDIVEIRRDCKKVPGSINLEGFTQSINFNIPAEPELCECDTLVLRFGDRTNVKTVEWIPEIVTDSSTHSYLISKDGTYTLRVELRVPPGVHSRDSLTVDFKDCL